MSAGARGGGGLDGTELFHQALQKNLDIIRNRLYNGAPPPALSASSRKVEGFLQGPDASSAGRSNNRPSTASKQQSDDLSRWLERVYGASLSAAPSTKATRVRPSSASAHTAQRRAGASTGMFVGYVSSLARGLAAQEKAYVCRHSSEPCQPVRNRHASPSLQRSAPSQPASSPAARRVGVILRAAQLRQGSLDVCAESCVAGAQGWWEGGSPGEKAAQAGRRRKWAIERPIPCRQRGG